MLIIPGDLVKLAQAGSFEVIVHGCNCFNTMSAGIAKQITKAWPFTYEADKMTPKGSKKKLGDYSYVIMEDLTIINAYTQFYYGRRGKNVDYEAIRSVFRKLKKDFSGKSFGIPKIGAGLAGGDWDIISKIINEEMVGEDVTLVLYEKTSGECPK